VNAQHKGLAAGRWKTLPFPEQMAHIGSEVERALNWLAKDNVAYSRQAFVRALELLDLSIDNASCYARLKELSRAREALADYFAGSNEYGSSPESWRKYFMPFAYFARANH
jgi:hypothetical protein